MVFKKIMCTGYVIYLWIMYDCQKNTAEESNFL